MGSMGKSGEIPPLWLDKDLPGMVEYQKKILHGSERVLHGIHLQRAWVIGWKPRWCVGGKVRPGAGNCIS